MASHSPLHLAIWHALGHPLMGPLCAELIRLYRKAGEPLPHILSDPSQPAPACILLDDRGDTYATHTEDVSRDQQPA